MQTFEILAASIDKPRTIKQMRKELEQLCYYARTNSPVWEVEDNALDYLPYTRSIVQAGKKQNHEDRDMLLAAITKKDHMIEKQQQLETQRQAYVEELLQGIHALPEKERSLLEQVYVACKDRKLMCASMGITEGTLRRRINQAIFHLAILLRKTILQSV